ncbi:hypothetical protein CLF_106484 [Clonorchis sinensis]|uniref:Uncharacterized protein n=1 Tax=Clonorchis sinensis TaxID=79923 RepID=G7YPZ2_CLOSI|nr:hypothetical protein CLF_106484 [Clonorchis sinensis]
MSGTAHLAINLGPEEPPVVLSGVTVAGASPGGAASKKSGYAHNFVIWNCFSLNKYFFITSNHNNNVGSQLAGRGQSADTFM